MHGARPQWLRVSAFQNRGLGQVLVEAGILGLGQVRGHSLPAQGNEPHVA
jgi:hypothetical protein